ncbi:OB-fold nucleic acid binding domain-containing protein [Candidatus Nanohalovita haloferacivicina]|uniref:OB-fold nucleic acid binding domain-containing protein n=1 Tax=Candidatus Nanohalovita haloferacivicina TaxID=2978046 RepID=UPI00325FC696|nr:Replication protein A (RPA) family protein [Candidatus Nanohalobia archaeon BNXNv]
MPQQKRQTAKLTNTEELNSGKYFQKEGFTPNYLLTPQGRRLSRARLVATVVDTFTNEDETYGSITLDDGLDTTQVKFFNDIDDVSEFEEGDIVEAIGKVREYQGQIYMDAEVLKDVAVEKELLHQLRYRKTMEEWSQIRDTVKQLKESGKDQEDIEKEMAGKLDEDEVDSLLQSFGESFSVSETQEDIENLEKDVLDAVENLDEGEGADYADIVDEIDEPEDKLEDTINGLLSDGTCYEPKPGKIKKL